MQPIPKRPPHFTQSESFEAKAHRWIQTGTRHHRINLDVASSAVLYQALAEYADAHAYKHLFRSAPSILLPKRMYERRKVKKGRERLLRQIVHTAKEMHQEHAVLRRFDLRSLAVHALASSYDLVSDEHFH